MFSAVLEGARHSPDEPYSRFYRYDAGRWVCMEIEAIIVDLLVLHPPGEGGGRPELVTLDREGVVWFATPHGAREERILEQGSDGAFGFLMFLRRSGPDLLAAGQRGQCYRRRGGTWEHDDASMFDFTPTFPRMRPGDIGEDATLTDIIELPGGEAYACGYVAIARLALFHRLPGTPWRWISLGDTGPEYDFVVPFRMLALSPDDILIATNKGILLRGNARAGFRVATDVARWQAQRGSPGDPIRFVSVVTFQGELYASSGLGTFRLDQAGRWHETLGPPQRSVYESDNDQTYVEGFLEVRDGVMWAFGSQSVSRFDGHAWTRIPIPPIYATPR